MPSLPQRGSCLCGEIVYRIDEIPLTLYACHCTDCQTMSGAAFTLSLLVRREALEFERGEVAEFRVELPDGRIKAALYCPRCITRMGGRARFPSLALVDPGTLHDTSWLRPVAHCWTRSAQPWIEIPEDTLRFDGQPGDDGALEMVHAWKAQRRDLR